MTTMNVCSSTPPPDYWSRRAAIARRAHGAGVPAADIDYADAEHRTWRTVLDALLPIWVRAAAEPAMAGLDRLGLDPTRVPQLREVTERLAPWTGFRFDAVPGLVAKEEFFGELADGRFLSTQYVRWSGSPLYTPEPDVIHEVVGHGHLLADERIARLHRLAGDAMTRVTRPESRQFVADVFWFSGEFGVVREAGRWRAYGAGLLSSVGELAWFADHASIEPLEVTSMGTTAYDITDFQPVLFGAESIDEVMETVGGFFAHCTDESIDDIRRRRRSRQEHAR